MKVCGKKCSGCGKYISGEYINALDQEWHKPCFSCTVSNDRKRLGSLKQIPTTLNRTVRDLLQAEHFWCETISHFVKSIIIILEINNHNRSLYNHHSSSLKEKSLLLSNPSLALAKSLTFQRLLHQLHHLEDQTFTIRHLLHRLFQEIV
jgi:hypothetical protein